MLAKLSPTRILIVDDHQIVLWGLEKLFECERPEFKVVGKATSCAEAIKLASRVKPDIVLLDIDLGNECGLDAIPVLTAHSETKVVALTDSRDSDLNDKAVLAGAMGIVAKEDPPHFILKAIEKVLKGEFWLDRATTGRIFLELSRQNKAGVSPVQQKISSLTTREREIIKTIVNNSEVTIQDIAKTIHISAHTLRNHLSAIYKKLGVGSRLELYAFAIKHFA